MANNLGSRRRTSRGNSLVEFTLAGIPVMFLLIATFEMARGMWMHTTVMHAVKEAVRFTTVHGNNCTITPNTCTVQIRDIAERIRDTGLGIDPDRLSLQFVSATRPLPSATTWWTLTASLTRTDSWPAQPPDVTPRDVGANRFQPIQIRARYEFVSALAMFWPGAARGSVLGTFYFAATSQDGVQY